MHVKFGLILEKLFFHYVHIRSCNKLILVILESELLIYECIDIYLHVCMFIREILTSYFNNISA